MPLPETYFSESAQAHVPIRGMPYPRLKATVDKVAKAEGGGPASPTLEALRNELARQNADYQAAQGRAAEADQPAAGSHTLQRENPGPRPAVMGDNAPPVEPGASDTAESITVELETAHTALIKEAADLDMAAAKIPAKVESDADVEAVNTWVVKAKSACQRAERERVSANAPILLRQRTTNTFFKGVQDTLAGTIKKLEDRRVPYLKAKADAAKAEADRKAAELRQAQQEAEQRAANERAERGRVQREADDAADRLRNASTADDIDLLTHEAVRANEQLQVKDAAVDQADKDIKAVGKAVDRQERIAAGDPHVLGKVGAGGANAALVTTWRPDVHNRERLKASLGPLGPYLGDTAIDAALDRAAKADPRPAVPGVDYIEDISSTTRATKA